MNTLEEQSKVEIEVPEERYYYGITEMMDQQDKKATKTGVQLVFVAFLIKFPLE